MDRGVWQATVHGVAESDVAVITFLEIGLIEIDEERREVIIMLVSKGPGLILLCILFMLSHSV